VSGVECARVIVVVGSPDLPLKFDFGAIRQIRKLFARFGEERYLRAGPRRQFDSEAFAIGRQQRRVNYTPGEDRLAVIWHGKDWRREHWPPGDQ